MEYTFYNKEINYITKFLKSYIMARPKDTEEKEESKDTEKKEESKIQCYNCRGFGHISNDCKKNRNIRDTTSSWRGRGRGYQPHSQRLNQISEETIIEDEEIVQECNMIQRNEKNTLKITHGKVDGKVVEILRDTG